MRTFVAAAIVAALISGLMSPLVRRLALRLGAVSTPGGRHIHKTSVPRLGGIAIFFGFFAPLIGLFFVESAVADVFTRDQTRVLGLFFGGAVICGVGIVDDTRGLRAIHKLYFQVLVGGLAYAAGYRIDAVELPAIGVLSMGVFALPVTVAWVVGVVNAVNLIDGLDGLAGGVVFFASLTNFVVAYLAGATMAGLLTATTMGAVLGFLFHNFNPARIFMGDSGSYFLGYVVAVTSLAGGPKGSAAVALLVPVLALGVPLFDVLLAMVRRVLERRSIFSPDRGHIHHRLLDLGITHRRAVFIIYGVCSVFAAAAVAVYIGKNWQVGVALLTASAVLVVLVRVAGYFEYFQSRKRIAIRRAADTERLRRMLPKLVLSLHDASSTNAALETFGDFCDCAQLAFELADQSSGDTIYRSALAQPEGGLVATFSLTGRPDSRLEARFAWASEIGDISAETEVLLQVAVDVLEAQLLQARSSLVAIKLLPAEHAQARTEQLDLPSSTPT